MLKRNELDPEWRSKNIITSQQYRVERVFDLGDLLVVNAARASFSVVKSKFDNNDLKLLNFLAREKHINPFYHFRAGIRLKEREVPSFLDRHDSAGYDYDPELEILCLNVFNAPRNFLEFFGEDSCKSAEALLKHGFTGRYFDQAILVPVPTQSPASWRTVRISCDIPTARQWFKSKIGADESEESRRYVKQEPSFFKPPKFRLASPDIKQGSLDEPLNAELLEVVDDVYLKALSSSREAYNTLLELGICAEQARMVLPQAMMTTFVDTISVRTLKRMHHLRSSSTAQKEIKTLVEEVIRVCSIDL